MNITTIIKTIRDKYFIKSGSLTVEEYVELESDIRQSIIDILDEIDFNNKNYGTHASEKLLSIKNQIINLKK